MRRKYGFTLVEVLFVVLIAGSVLAFAVPAYKRMQERGDYHAALGNLLALGNAANSLKRDLKLNTGVSITTVPTSGSYIQYGGTNWATKAPSTTAEKKQSWNQYVVSQGTDANTRKAFIWALTEFEYLKPLTNTKGYSFYLLNGTSTNAAVKQCKSPTNSAKKPIACMLKSGTKKDCYLGAVMLEEGSVERLKGTDCK